MRRTGLSAPVPKSGPGFRTERFSGFRTPRLPRHPCHASVLQFHRERLELGNSVIPLCLGCRQFLALLLGEEFAPFCRFSFHENGVHLFLREINRKNGLRRSSGFAITVSTRRETRR